MLRLFLIAAATLVFCQSALAAREDCFYAPNTYYESQSSALAALRTHWFSWNTATDENGDPYYSCKIAVTSGETFRRFYWCAGDRDATDLGCAPEELVPQKEERQEQQICEANPVNMLTGFKVETETDYVGNGPFPLRFTRWYNSGNADRPWSFSYSSHLVIDGDFVGVYLDQGLGYVFRMNGTVGESEFDVAASLTLNGGNYELLDENGMLMTYDTNGVLQEVRTREGFSHTLSYANDVLSSVSDDFGNTLVFTADGSGRIESMTTPDGEVYHYRYSPAGYLDEVVLPDETPALLTDNPTREYLYESVTFPAGITGIIDERGVRYATFDYNGAGQAILSEHANGTESHTFAYATHSTTVTNPLGKQTTYHYQDVFGTKRLVRIEGHPTTLCEATNMERTYDSHGYLTSQTDHNGNVTEYTYTHTGADPRANDYFAGLETSRIEGVGSPESTSTVTTWDTVHRLPATISVDGKMTSFSYDSEGRLLVQTETDTTSHTVPYSTAGDTRTWTYTYNAEGLMETADGPRTDVSDITTYGFDPDGNLAQVTNPLGHVTRILERDGDGQPTRMEDANGLITRLAYDERRRLITQTIESASGDVVTSYIYDDADQLIQVTNPSGLVLNY